VAKHRRVAKDAKTVTISLTPEEELVLQVIESRRRKRGEARDTRNEVISDALWHFLVEVEGIPRDQIESLLPEMPKKNNQSNLKKFPRKNKLD
jgi:hypothetical protein